MLVTQIKLKPTKVQEKILEDWLWMLTGVWNTASRRIELSAKDKIYYSKFDMMGMTSGASDRTGISSDALRTCFADVWTAWNRCFKKISGKPRLKGNRRKLSSIGFSNGLKRPITNRLNVPNLGKIKFLKQRITEGKIKCFRIIRRASGWYAVLFINANRKIEQKGNNIVGIDPGFSHLLTLSNGEKISHPREIENAIKRIGQAQRGHRKKLVARLHEKVSNIRKDRNHKLSLHLVQECSEIYISKDNSSGISRRFGKSVMSSAHSQLRNMLSYKSLAGGRTYVEVEPKNSTKTCSACRSLSGPTGLAGLSVRQWKCENCGVHHDRDINAAINTLIVGRGLRLEGKRKLSSGT